MSHIRVVGQVVKGFDRTFGQPTAVTRYGEAPELSLQGPGGDGVFQVVTSDPSFVPLTKLVQQFALLSCHNI